MHLTGGPFEDIIEYLLDLRDNHILETAKTLTVLRGVCRSLFSVATLETFWFRIGRSLWLDSVCKEFGLDETRKELSKLKNVYLRRKMHGFGLSGKRWIISQEAEYIQAEIDSLELKWNKFQDLKVPPNELNHISWLEFFRSSVVKYTLCTQCGEEYKEIENKPSSCVHHSRGSGQIFDWGESDFIGKDYTCCNSNIPAVGCKVGRHSTMTGIFHENNINKDWSTASM